MCQWIYFGYRVDCPHPPPMHTHKTQFYKQTYLCTGKNRARTSLEYLEDYETIPHCTREAHYPINISVSINA